MRTLTIFFLQYLQDHAFTGQSTLTTVSDCTIIINTQCRQNGHLHETSVRVVSLFNSLQFELFNFQTLSHLESDVAVGDIVFHKHIF